MQAMMNKLNSRPFHLALIYKVRFLSFPAKPELSGDSMVMGVGTVQLAREFCVCIALFAGFLRDHRVAF